MFTRKLATQDELRTAAHEQIVKEVQDILANFKISMPLQGQGQGQGQGKKYHSIEALKNAVSARFTTYDTGPLQGGVLADAAMMQQTANSRCVQIPYDLKKQNNIALERALRGYFNAEIDHDTSYVFLDKPAITQARAQVAIPFQRRSPESTDHPPESPDHPLVQVFARLCEDKQEKMLQGFETYRNQDPSKTATLQAAKRYFAALHDTRQPAPRSTARCGCCAAAAG